MYQPGKSPTSFGAAHCDFCHHPVPYLDFGEGRAFAKSGKTCCAACAEDGAWVRLDTVPPGVVQRRATPRYLPSSQCELALRIPGWKGLVTGNLSLRWIDVSEGGLRAVIRKPCPVEARLVARILHRPPRKSYPAAVRIRHVRDSAKFPGAFIAGMQFENPSEALLELIRRLHSPEFSPKHAEGTGEPAKPDGARGSEPPAGRE